MASPDVPVHKQWADFRALLAQKTHPEFAVIEFRSDKPRAVKFAAPAEPERKPQKPKKVSILP